LKSHFIFSKVTQSVAVNPYIAQTLLGDLQFSRGQAQAAARVL